MERVTTILFRTTLVALPIGLTLVILGLGPSSFAEARIAGAWYLKRLLQTPTMLAIAVAASATLLFWLLFRFIARQRFNKAMRLGAVPARRVETRSDDQLASRARVALDPELGRSRPDPRRIIDALLGTPVDLGAAELLLAPEGLDITVSLRFGMEQLPVTRVAPQAFDAVVEEIRHMIGVDELGSGTIELRDSAGNTWIDASVEAAPGADGNAVQLRLTVSKRSGYGRTLEQLGLGEAALNSLGAALERDKGLIVLGGLAEAGLTSTLYAAAHRRYRARGQRSETLIGVEPHVRLELPFMLQLEVGGAVPAAVLQSALTEDYEAIFVRKVGDEASASLALQAARERLVVITVEADGALAAVARLSRLGDPKVLAETLLLAQGQRLLPTLCPLCRREASLDDAARKQLAAAGLPTQGFRAPGCEACQGRGVAEDKTAIFWSLERSEWLQSAVQRGHRLPELRLRAEEQSYRGSLEGIEEPLLDGAISVDEAISCASRRAALNRGGRA